MEKSCDEFTPRAYQVDLYEKALADNSILYLPTGAGKTYIAIMLIKAMSPSIRMPFSEGGKRTIFAVNTVPLVTQQTAYITRHTDLTCQGYSGDMGGDFWAGSRWYDEFEKNQVLVMTAQIFVDLLNHGYITLKQVNLLIFDECHRAVGDQPMRQIMRKFEDCPQREQPRILGMSATLLNSNVKFQEIADIVHDLEITLHSKVITVDSLAPVASYGKPKETYVVCSPVTRKFNPLIDETMTFMISILGMVTLKEPGRNEKSSRIFQPQRKTMKLRNIILDIQEHIATQDLYGGSTAILLHMLQLDKMRKNASDGDTLMVLNFLISKCALLRKIMEQQMGCSEVSEMTKIMNYSSERVIKLLETLRIYYDAKDTDKSSHDHKFSAIVFVKRRFTAKILYDTLKKAAAGNERYSFLKTDYVVGSSLNPFKNTCEHMSITKWNKEALIRFRTGVSNCLIATDVIDEGVDIPLCSLVVRYDFPTDFRAYVQSKGRARSSDSKYVMMLSQKEAAQEKSRHQTYARKEVVLEKYLIGNTVDRPLPIPEELKDQIYAKEIKPYNVVDAKGIQYSISDTAAVSLIHRYCSTLCGSKLVSCVPTIKLQHTDDENNFRVSIKMPIKSPLRKEILSDGMPTITLAKRSAALKACIELHKLGELNDRLLPTDSKDIAKDAVNILKNWRVEENSTNR